MSHDYALFVCDAYYPAGGWYDLDGIFQTVDEAMARGKEAAGKDASAHIVHLQERRIIMRGAWEYVPSTLTGRYPTEFFSWKPAAEAG